MKRLSSSDSLGAMMSICPNTNTDEVHNQVNDNNNSATTHSVYTSSEFQTMLDGLDEEGCCVEESGDHHHHHNISEKKRRLSVDQVKALEKNFEVENKLEPERKVKLAQELGLQPRQVAVWFQNRRARWKTKNLERDYGVLKSSYDGLKLNYEKLQRDNEALLKEIKELKEKLISEDGNSDAIESDTDEKKPNLEITPPVITSFLDEEEYCGSPEMIKVENFSEDHEAFLCGSTPYVHYHDFKKDGSSCDSDSSAILNEDINNNSTSPKNNAAISSSSHHQYLLDIHSSTGDAYGYKNHQDQIVKIEEHSFFGHDHEESCTNLFSDDQAPSLPWYCSEDWN